MSAKTMPRARLISRACLLAVVTLTLCALLLQGCADTQSADAPDSSAAPANAHGASAAASDGFAPARSATATLTPTAEYIPSPTAKAIVAPGDAAAPSATLMLTVTPAPATPTATSMPTFTPATFTLTAQCSNGIAVPNPEDSAGLVADCAALLASKDALEGTNAILNWSIDVVISDWEGVTIAGDRVSRLGLSRTWDSPPSDKLMGNIPAELGNLANLEWLHLTNNQLTGEIPSELGNLANLQQLVLTSNQLTGEISSELGNLANLHVLYLTHNQLTGKMPLELGNLVDLRELYIYDNQLTGGIPPELGNLANLERLDLSRNELTGEIPSELGNLSDLWELDLSGNQLAGGIPPELGNLSNLWELYLDRNQLTGEIPPELGNLSNLWELYLDRNQLTGEIPSELGNFADLGFLRLSNNQLMGCIPASLRAPMDGLGEIELIGLPFCDVPTATPTPTPTITPTPTATPWAPQACAADILPYYFRIEELILSADIVARVRLIEIDDHIATFQTFKKWYEPHLWYEFEVLEYLKGSGSATIWGMTSGYGCWHTTDTAEEARSAIEYLRRERDARWDDREAIVFLSNVGTESVERTPSISHPDRYWLGTFLPGYGATESHSLTWAGGWFPMSPSDGASGASGEQRFIIVDPDNPPGDEWVNDHTKRARNAWRKLWASGSSDMTTMSISDLNLLIANEPELLRLEQEREIIQMRDRTAPDKLTATQTSAGIALRWIVEADLYFTTSYRVSRKASGEAEFTKISDVQPQWNVIYEDITATEPGVAYTYKVTAILKDDIPSRFNTSYGEYGGEAEVSMTTADVHRTPTPSPTATPAR